MNTLPLVDETTSENGGFLHALGSHFGLGLDLGLGLDHGLAHGRLYSCPCMWTLSPVVRPSVRPGLALTAPVAWELSVSEGTETRLSPALRGELILQRVTALPILVMIGQTSVSPPYTCVASLSVALHISEYIIENLFLEGHRCLPLLLA